MKLTHLYLKPVDQFYFRGHNDLTPGSNSAAGTNFMPRPGTVYGALRAAFIHKYHDFTSFAKNQVNEEVDKWMGTPNRVGDFKMKGLFVAQGNHPLIPLPLDLQVIKEGEDEVAYPLQLEENNKHSSNNESYRLVASKDGKSSSSEGKFINIESFKDLIFNKVPKIPLKSTGDFLSRTSKLGIALDYNSRTSRDKMLYNLQEYSFKELESKEMSFMVMLEKGDAPSFENIPLARVGGGNNPFTIKEEQGKQFLSDQEKKKLIEKIKENDGRAKIIMLTPAIWKNGSRPSIFNENTNKLEIEGMNPLSILTIAIGRPVVIGGWDIQRGRPKTRMNAVPAGTVIYVKIEEEDVETFVNRFYLGNLTDQYSFEGYGLTMPALAEINEEE